MNRMAKWALGALAMAALLTADAVITERVVTRRTNRAECAPAYSEARDDPMARFRLEREQLRAREEAQLNQIIYSAGAEGEDAQARQRLMDMLKHAEAENTLEGVLRSRGFEDALVTVSDHSANVLIRGESPTRDECAVILDLVMSQTGLTGGNVKIIPVK